MKKYIAVLISFLFGIITGLGLYHLYLYLLANPAVLNKGNDIPLVNITDTVQEDNGNKTEPELEITTWIEGLSNPWDIVFIDKTKAVFTERNNRINLWDNGVIRLLLSPQDTYVKGEGGMLGLALDPDLLEFPYLYACFNSNLAGELDVRVARFKFNETYDELIERVDIITGLPSNISGRHSGCQLEMGPDGYLWIGTGDATAGTNPQDPQSLGGKILRADRDGNPAPGNLTDPFNPLIYSYGHRNIQGLAFLDKANAAGIIGFSAEHGPNTDDEINPLVPGNFGWNPVPGYNEAVPMTDSLKYPDAIKAIWSSGNPTLAVSGLASISGEVWGSWDGTLAAAIQKSSRVKILTLDDKGNVIAEQDILNTYGRIRTIQLGPDLSLYVLTDNGSGKDQILKVTPL